MSDLESQLAKLRLSIVERPPVCFGTLPVAPNECTLFYRKGEAVRCLDLVSASPEELRLLSESCDKASFGLNSEDVHDESYRKAGKIDAQNFAIPFNAVQAGLLDVISTELLEGGDQMRSLRAELYKLNVYDEGSFFKAHVDTPRDEAMFGSLVIIFPTQHSGGVLTFRHSGKEWSLDSGALIAEQSQPSVAYAAFYSDVEHEVFAVTQGYRVTLTYNLYFTPKPLQLSKPVGNPIPAHQSTLEETLRTLLADPAFLPDGGFLGFGLCHQYPLDKSIEEEKIPVNESISKDDDDDMDDASDGEPQEIVIGQERKPPKFRKVKPFVPGRQLRALEQYLKGSDAMIKRVCDKLGLKIFLGVVYRARTSTWSIDTSDVLCPCVANLDGARLREEDTTYYLRRYYGGRLLSNTPYRCREMDVKWVTDVPSVNLVAQSYMAYGNQAELMHAYFRICMFVMVGEPGSRVTIENSQSGGQAPGV